VRKYLLISLAAATCIPAASLFAQAPAKLPDASGPLNVYTTGLGDGWTNAGTAETELSADVGGSARKPIRFVAGPGQTLILHHAPMTAGYRKLSFLIQSVGGDAPLQVIALKDGQPMKAEGKTITAKPGGWTKVEIPLANIGAEDAAFDGIEFLNAGTAAAPTTFVTEIQLS